MTCGKLKQNNAILSKRESVDIDNWMFCCMYSHRDIQIHTVKDLSFKYEEATVSFYSLTREVAYRHMHSTLFWSRYQGLWKSSGHSWPRQRGRNGDPSLVEGDSHNIDILPSWLHFGLTWSYKGYCQSKVVFQKELQRHVRIITQARTHTHTQLPHAVHCKNLLHTYIASHGFLVLRNIATQTSLHAHTMQLMWLRSLHWMRMVIWMFNGFKCQCCFHYQESIVQEPFHQNTETKAQQRAERWSTYFTLGG